MTVDPLDPTQRNRGRSIKDKRSTEGKTPDTCNCLQSDSSHNLKTNQAPLYAKSEVTSLAAELGRAYQRETAFYREQMKLTLEEADLRALGLDQMAGAANPGLDRIRDCPPEYLHWSDLTRLAENNPEELISVWEDLKAAAGDELDSGHRIAKSLEWDGTPWDRARFLAIRERVQRPGSNSDGLEAILVDMVAEAYSTWLELNEQLHMLLKTDGELKAGDIRKEGRWGVPHKIVDEVISRVEQRTERAHKHLLSTSKMLADYRRSTSTVIVGHADQVNVAHQQMNVIPPTS